MRFVLTFAAVVTLSFTYLVPSAEAGCGLFGRIARGVSVVVGRERRLERRAARGNARAAAVLNSR